MYSPSQGCCCHRTGRRGLLIYKQFLAEDTFNLSLDNLRFFVKMFDDLDVAKRKYVVKIKYLQ